MQCGIVFEINVISTIGTLQTQSSTLLLVLDQLIAFDANLEKVIVGSDVEIEKLLNLDSVRIQALFASFFQLEHLNNVRATASATCA
jgi:hypothetical protein